MRRINRQKTIHCEVHSSFFYFNLSGADPPPITSGVSIQLRSLQAMLWPIINHLIRRISGQKTVRCEVRSLLFYFNFNGADPPLIVLDVSGSILVTPGGILAHSESLNVSN